MAPRFKLTDDQLRALHDEYMAHPELSAEDVTPIEVTPQTVLNGWKRLGLERKPANRPRLRKSHTANTRHLPTYLPVPKVTLYPTRGHRRRGRL